jgi:hypothetical protein
VAGSTILESVDVVFDGLNSNTLLLGALGEHLRLMNTLSSRGNLLSTHEEVVRVSEGGVVRVKHSVERTSSNRVAVKHVEVSVVLFSNESAESLLGLSAEIIVDILFVASFLEHLNTVLKVDFDDGVSTLELLEGVLVVDDLKFASEAFLNVFEKEDHQLANQIQNLEVMIFEFHLHIESGELTQVAVGVGVLSAENGSNLEDTLEVTTESHLFVELRGLCKTSILLEVLESEHVGASLTGATNELGGVDFNEVVCNHELAVDLANTRLEAENCLVGGHTQVDDTVVEANVLLNHGHLLFGTLLGLFVSSSSLAILSSLIQHNAGGVFELEGKHGNGLVDTPKLFAVEFNLLRAASNGLLGLDHVSNDLNNRFLGDL